MNKNVKQNLLTISILTCSLNCFAHDKKEENSVSSLGLGIGIGVEQYRHGSYIDSASTHGESRLVTIDKEYETIPSMWLTANWNFTFKDLLGQSTAEDDKPKKVRYGLFVGAKLFDINASSGLNGFSLGPQVSFTTKERQYSLGIGWVNHQVKKFANGIREGQPLPDQYTDIRYREHSENSYMLMFSTNLINSK